MDRRERFVATVQGERADRPPVSAWIHFGTAHLDPERTADLHLSFADSFDWDYIKLMHDYRFPLPDAAAETYGADYLWRIGDSQPDPASFDRQTTVIRRVCGGASERPVLETLFNPLQTLIRSAGARVLDLVRAEPEPAHAALGQITGALCGHVQRLQEMGVHGLFLSVNGAAGSANGWGITPSEYAEFVAPYDKEVLRAASGMIRVAHVHGYQLDMDRLKDYEYEVLSWAHHYTAPELGTLGGAYGKVPMAGLDEVKSLYYTPGQVIAEVARAVRAVDSRVLVGPGCTLHSDTPPAVLHALRRSVEDAPRDVDLRTAD